MKRRAIAYSAAELRFIEEHCPTMSRRDLHQAFVHAFGRVDVMFEHIHGLCKRRGWGNGRQRPWTAEEDAQLRASYPDQPADDVARALGRTLTSTYARAKHLGLRKSAAFLASTAAGRLVPGDARGTATRFHKGNVPATKGQRRPGYAPGRMSETQFKKGQRTKWHPVGSERVIDGYRWRKISDIPNVCWTANWRQIHILEWEKQHGPLPVAMALKCLDGDRGNCDLSNWELVPRGLLPRLNRKSGRRFDKAPAELKPTILAVARLEHAAAGARKKKEAVA